MRRVSKVCVFLFIGSLMMPGVSRVCCADDEFSGYASSGSGKFSAQASESSSSAEVIRTNAVIADVPPNSCITGYDAGGANYLSLASTTGIDLAKLPDKFTLTGLYTYCAPTKQCTPLGDSFGDIMGTSSGSGLIVGFGKYSLSGFYGSHSIEASASTVKGTTTAPISTPALLLGFGLLGLIGFGVRRCQMT